MHIYKVYRKTGHYQYEYYTNRDICLKDLKMCLDGIGKIEEFTANELLTLYNYISLS